MQRLSMIACTAITVLGLSGAAFTYKTTAPTPNPAATPTQPTQSQTPASAPVSVQAFATSYYWYDVINGMTYNDYETIAYEEFEMEAMWGCIVDQNPLGGTLIEEGFWSKNPN